MQKIKWGVLGTATIGANCTIPGMKQAENCELTAIAGRNPEKTKMFQEKFGFQKAYGSYEALLEDTKIEAVYIPLPNTLHYEWAMKALKCKKHVLCEKPLAPTKEEEQKLFDTARENGVFLMEAFAYQHSPYIKAVKGEIDKGSIGDVRYMESAFITSDYNGENIRMRKETKGGCTYDLGVYNTSLTLALLGEEPSDVKAIADFSEEGVDLLTSVLLKFPSGKKAVFDCGMVLATQQDKRIDRFEIQGTKGSIKSVDFTFNGDGALSYSLTDLDGNKQIKTIDTPHNYKLEVEQLGRCILEGETPLVSAGFSLANAELIDKILTSIGY